MRQEPGREQADDDVALQWVDTRLAVVASWGLVILLASQSVLWAVSPDGPAEPAAAVVAIVLSVVSAAGFLTLQRAIMFDGVPAGARLWTAALVVAALAASAIGSWAMVGPAAAIVMLVAPPRLALVAVLTIIVGDTLVSMALGESGGSAVAVAVVQASAAGCLYVLTRMVVVLGQLARARALVARIEVDAERRRISREVHDVLGRSLVAASLRVQIAQRMLDSDPDGAQKQLDEAVSVVTAGQQTLRRVVSGTHMAGLPEELAVAGDLLRRLGIRLTLHEETVGDPTTEALFARILRECVTNLLKHAGPRTVDIRVAREDGAFLLRIRNDGVGGLASRETSPGTGLSDLATRVADAGGTLEVTRDGSEFAVTCRVPRSPVGDDPRTARPADARRSEVS